MMKQTVKAIFLDIDGTLMAPGRNGPSTADTAAIQQARGAGHLFFLNTGRSLANIPQAFIRAPWLDGIVAAGGSHVLLADDLPCPAWNKSRRPRLKTLYRKVIAQDMLKKACALFIKTASWCFFEGEEHIYALNFPVFADSMYRPLIVEHEDDFFTKYKDAPISKLTMQGAIFPEEQKLLGGGFSLFPQTGYHEGIIKGESKSKGMTVILKALGMTTADSIAIGDSMNDMDMIRFAGTGIAMGNACEALKQAASYISDDVEHSGVSTALLRHVMRYSTSEQ